MATRKKKTKKVNRVARPPLTKKARAAIALYVEIKANYHYLYLAINLTLKADRMPREKLYSYLNYRGYYWRHGY